MQLFFDIVGLIGVALILFAYALLQLRRLAGDSVRFYQVNLIGTLLIIASLLWDWNPAAFVMEVVWACISVAGLMRHRRARPAAPGKDGP